MLKKGNRVKLNSLGKKHWKYQAPDNTEGVIINIENYSWPSYLFPAKLSIRIKWDNTGGNIYPETALELISPVYFNEETDLSLDKLLKLLE